jgi:uncharacterized damage-inducible protein DinB
LAQTALWSMTRANPVRGGGYTPFRDSATMSTLYASRVDDTVIAMAAACRRIKIRRMPRSFLLEPPASPLPAGRHFLRHARFRLRDDYLAKITTAMMELTDEQIWSRPNDSSNSIGNLILHLCGNARQWIVAGIGGAADARDRAKEFAHRERIGHVELSALLEQTLGEVDVTLVDLERALIADGTDAPLQRPCVPQGFAQTVLDAVFHVVEHFSYHTGQIILLAKWHVGERVRLYDDARLNAGS